MSKMSEEIKNDLRELYKKYGVRGNTFIDLAKSKKNIPRKYALEFLNTEVVHDQKIDKPRFIPIVSKTPGAYQMDTFINQKQSDGLNYLMIINVNTRKAYAYPMKGKGAAEVLKALKTFKKEVKDIYSILSDQDAAYLSAEVRNWMSENNIHHYTVTDDNHNNLGIINRFMRTIRDKAYDKEIFDPKLWNYLTPEGDFKGGAKANYDPTKFINKNQMQELIEAYNDTPHKSLRTKIVKSGKKKIMKYAPNDMNNELEQDYIQRKKVDTVPYDFKEGDKVRVVADNNKFGKKRRAVSDETFTVDGRSGNLFRVIAENHAVNEYPGYRIVHASNKGKRIAGTDIKAGKRGKLERIESYNRKTNKYHVIWEGNYPDDIPPSYLREGNPTKLSREERIFWMKQKDIPPIIRKFI